MPPTDMRREAPADQRRDLMTRELHLRVETIDTENRSVEAVLATEGQATVFDMRTWEIIDEVLRVDGMRSVEQVVMLESHNRYLLDAVLGSVRNIRREGSTIVGRLFFTKDDERAERAWNKVSQGHLTDVSVGYRAEQYDDIAPNTSKVVKGKRYTAGSRTLRITTDWQLREGSLVPIGADQAAKIREDTATLTKETHIMDKALREYLEHLGLRADATEEQAWAFLGQLEGDELQRAMAMKTGKQPPSQAPPPKDPPEPKRTAADPEPTPPVDADSIRADAVRAERKRIAHMRELAGDDVPEEVVERAITDGWDDARASREFLNAIRQSRTEPVSSSGPGIHSRDHDRECNVRSIAAGCLIRAGLPVVDENQPQSVRQDQERAAETGHRYRDMSLIDMCRESIRLAGGRAPMNRDETIRAAVSTAELTNIFTTVVNAQLLKSYTEYPDSTEGWVRTTEVPDFKSNERTRLGKTGGLKKLPRGGTADHATISDVMEEYKAARYAYKFQIDEQDIIDDRFGALLDMPREMGAAARRLRPDLVYAILLANSDLQDSVALFHATHANLGTAALAAAAVQAAIAAMAKQTENSANLNIAPRFLIVPQDLKFTALILLKSAERVIASSSGGTYNPLLDEQIDLRVDNRIGAAGVTDPATGTAYTGSTTNWFMAASPLMAPTIEVGYVRGTGRGPVLRSFVLDRGQWGIGWDIKMDIGAKALDYRGLYKSAGTG